MATRTNFLQARETYNRYYGDFRGVDFSSDHTQVDEHRLAYAVNMFRDYQSSQGQASVHRRGDDLYIRSHFKRNFRLSFPL